MTFSIRCACLCLALAASFSPGPGVLLAISTTMALGARRTACSSAGNAVGVFLVSCVAVSGVGLLFQRSPLAFSALKLAGAHGRDAGKGCAGGRYMVFRRGLLVACSNPTSILFFAGCWPRPPARGFSMGPAWRGFSGTALPFMALAVAMVC